MSFKDFNDNFNRGKAVYKGMNTVSESSSALGNFRTMYIGSVKAIRSKKETLEKKIQEIKGTYLPSKANPMIEDLRKAYNSDIHTMQLKLTEKLNSTLQAKEEACRKYVVIPPSADQLALLQTLKLRGVQNVPDEEWSMLISSLAGNYQCASVLKSLCDEAGKNFVAPFTPADGLQDIQRFKNIAENAINNIENPEGNYYSLEFIREDVSNSVTSSLIEKLDTEIATTVPSGDLSLRNRLKTARDNALHVGDYDTFKEIGDFMIENSAMIETPQEREQNFLLDVEAMIEKGMNAKEASPAEKYSRHLDEVLRKVDKTSDKNTPANNGDENTK